MPNTTRRQRLGLTVVGKGVLKPVGKRRAAPSTLGLAVCSRKQHEVCVDRNSQPSPPKQTVYDLDATVICREGAALGSRSKTFVATLVPTSRQTCCSTLKRDTLLPRPLSQNVRRVLMFDSRSAGHARVRENRQKRRTMFEDVTDCSAVFNHNGAMEVCEQRQRGFCCFFWRDLHLATSRK